ncbi:beta-glucosidase, partial [Daedaleopsis nitida]
STRARSNTTSCSTGYSCVALNDTSVCVLDGTQTSGDPSETASTSVVHSGVANISPLWQAAYAKAKPVVANMTNSDKTTLMTGLGLIGGPCIGSTAAVKSVPGFPSSGFCLQDSPVGVRYTDGVSLFPSELNAAATWNRTLIRARGEAMGAEFRGKGVHVALAPMMNLMRAPAAGRNWEGGGGDPYLTGEVAYESIVGVQSQGVQACAKHFINNEQEHFRDSSSSIVDDRCQHELYLHPFLRSVQAGVASVMCSYINGTYACENDKTINGLLKGELGFQGYVMSDWYATHSTAPAANGGLDMTMPGDKWFGSFSSYFGSSLEDAVKQETVAQERLDDMATRILAAWYMLGQDEGYPELNFNSWLSLLGAHVNVQGDHGSLIRTIGGASAVLLKNEGSVLPLQAPRTMAIVGTGARSALLGANECLDRSCNDGVLALGWGSGTASFPYLIAPQDAITTRAKAEGTTVASWTLSDDAGISAGKAKGKDVALVFITADSGEAQYTVEGNQGDRNDLFAWHNGDEMVKQVAAVNNNTIVVVNSVGPILMEAWIENPNGMCNEIWAGIPGQEAGNAITDVLYGDVNPSGRLPFTIAKDEADYSARVIYKGSGTVQIPYSEGLFIDYRHFDANGIEPRFPFGHGLSYTTFSYSDLDITGSTEGGERQALGPGSSLDPWLHDPVVTVSFTLVNTGDRAGTEVVQLYTSPPASANSAPLNLKGFDAVYLGPGESKTVSLQLSRYDFSVWDVVSQSWQIPAGETGISVGASSRNLKLKGSITN